MIFFLSICISFISIYINYLDYCILFYFWSSSSSSSLQSSSSSTYWYVCMIVFCKCLFLSFLHVYHKCCKNIYNLERYINKLYIRQKIIFVIKAKRILSSNYTIYKKIGKSDLDEIEVVEGLYGNEYFLPVLFFYSNKGLAFQNFPRNLELLLNWPTNQMKNTRARSEINFFPDKKGMFLVTSNFFFNVTIMNKV